MDGEQEKREIGDVLFDWKRKFDNFWYHHKVAFMMSVAILAFIVFCIAQCASKVKGDVNIAYVGSKELNTEEYEELQSDFEKILGGDLNGDGKIKAGFKHFLYMTSVQVEDAYAGGKVVDMQSLVTVQTQISLELAQGDSVIYFMDPEVYKEFAKTAGLFMPLEDSLGYVPENANDVYTLRLGNLPCWDYYAGIHSFPSNTVVAVRDLQLSEEENKGIQERYQRNLAMFKELAEFTFSGDTENTEE